MPQRRLSAFCSDNDAAVAPTSRSPIDRSHPSGLKYHSARYPSVSVRRRVHQRSCGCAQTELSMEKWQLYRYPGGIFHSINSYQSLSIYFTALPTTTDGVPPAKYLQGQQRLAVRKIKSISKRYILCHESRNTITGRTAVKLKLTPKPPQ